MAVLPTRLAYYVEHHTDERYWDSVWDAVELQGLVEVAERSPLTRFLERHIGAGDRVLEAGCGLGQYVELFSRRGIAITGVDFAPEAIARHKSVHPDADIRVGDVEHLDMPDCSYDVYISIGLIEHYEDGPAALLREARRVLRPGGTILLSTPYLNGSRLALARRFRGQMARVRDSGGEFYQWAFSARELDRILAGEGFEVFDRGRYDVGKGLRMVKSLLTPHEKAVARNRAARASAAKPAGPVPAPAGGSPLKARLTTNPLALRAFAHMQIVAAKAT